MRFFSIKVGDYFYIEEKSGPKNNPKIERTLCKKVTALGYTMAGEEVLGEHSIDPHTDTKIVRYTPPDTVAEEQIMTRPPAVKKAVVKKSAKKSVKKTNSRLK